MANMNKKAKGSYRDPAVAGIFYPIDPVQLQDTIQALFNTIEHPTNPHNKKRPKAIIVPHAGYEYSGQIAAIAYSELIPFCDNIHHVVILGPAHRVYLEAIAHPTVDYFTTPLGNIPVDVNTKHILQEFAWVIENDEAHKEEHSLEVQLPFLQTIFPALTVTPLVVGNVSPEKCAQVIERLMSQPNTTIVISSDLSHFLSYYDAQKKDLETSHSITHLREAPIDGTEACGCHPINGLLNVARKNQYNITQLGLCNSGDITGDKSSVVGYGAWRMDCS